MIWRDYDFREGPWSIQIFKKVDFCFFFSTISNAIVAVFVFVQLCAHFCLCLCLLIGHTVSPYPSDQLSERSQVSTTALQCSEVKTLKKQKMSLTLMSDTVTCWAVLDRWKEQFSWIFFMYDGNCACWRLRWISNIMISLLQFYKLLTGSTGAELRPATQN